MSLTLAALRRWAVRRSLLPPTSLAAAVARLGFVQADPIRAPARAQDLILRPRVAGYRAGDLERAYPALGLDEDAVYAYGFVPPATRRLLHPRLDAHGTPHEPAGLGREVLAFVRAAGPAHPRDVAAAFGDAREVNAWGGQSRATTRALERLHYWGWLRVARRDRGVRVYAAAPPAGDPPLPPEERRRRLALLAADVFAPVPEASLREILGLVFRLGAPHLDAAAGGARPAGHAVGGRRALVDALVREGALEAGVCDGVRYLWPAGERPEGGWPGAADAARAPRLRLLAPFDPVVWDRRRFEHLWGWAYRFEAYTPAARRERGYYALPLLWGDRAAGWATLAVRAGRLEAAVGFAGRPLEGRAFAAALGAELARVRRFLGAEA